MKDRRRLIILLTILMLWQIGLELISKYVFNI